MPIVPLCQVPQLQYKYRLLLIIMCLSIDYVHMAHWHIGTSDANFSFLRRCCCLFIVTFSLFCKKISNLTFAVSSIRQNIKYIFSAFLSFSYISEIYLG